MQPVAGSIGSGVLRALCVVTKDRADLLERCLRSFAKDCLVGDARPELVVFDDTGDTQERERVRAMLARLGVEVGHGVRYSGAEEKQSYTEHLARESEVLLTTITFALGQSEDLGNATRSGANRNAALFDSVGDAVLLADDDVVLEALAPRDATLGLKLSKAQSAWDMCFFSDLESARRQLRPAPGILAPHAALLGASLAGCAERARTRVPAKPSSAVDPRVKITVHGAVGDSGWGSINPFSLLLYHPELLQDTPPELVLGRILRRTVPCATVSRGSWFQAMAFGLDHRDLLPPFSPVGRNQDGLFMHHLLHCFDDALVAYLPSTVLHEPPGSRRFEPAEMERAVGRFRYSELLMMATSLLQPGAERPASGEERLVQLGGHLRTLAELPPRELRSAFHQRAVRGRQRSLAYAEHRLSSTPLSEAWSSIFASTGRALREAIKGADFGVPDDLDPERGVEEIWLRTQRFTRDFGDLLTAWPALISAAKRLRARGIRPSAPL